MNKIVNKLIDEIKNIYLKTKGENLNEKNGILSTGFTNYKK